MGMTKRPYLIQCSHDETFTIPEKEIKMSFGPDTTLLIHSELKRFECQEK